MSDKVWEAVAPELLRIEVPGGWIYKVSTYHGGVALEFVPDPDRQAPLFDAVFGVSK